MKAHWRRCPGERRYSDTNAQCVAGLVFQHGNCRDCFVSRDPETGIAFEVDFLSKHVAKPKETHDETKDRDTTTDAPKGTGGHEGDPAKPADPKAAGAPRAGKTVLPITATLSGTRASPGGKRLLSGRETAPSTG